MKKITNIDLIAGARPNFMKIAPIIAALKAAETRGSLLRYRLIHTGQHYDRLMSGDFFGQLGIPEPDINLEVGSGTQAEPTAAIMVRYEKVLLRCTSDLCLSVPIRTKSVRPLHVCWRGNGKREEFRKNGTERQRNELLRL